MKTNIKKLEDVDVVFVNTPMSEEENSNFSEYLSIRKGEAVEGAHRLLVAEKKRKQTN